MIVIIKDISMEYLIKWAPKDYFVIFHNLRFLPDCQGLAFKFCRRPIFLSNDMGSKIDKKLD